MILASLEGDTGVAFESRSLSCELTFEQEYLGRVELWPKGYLDFAFAWLNC